MTPTKLMSMVSELRPGERNTYHVGNFVLDEAAIGWAEGENNLKKLAYMARTLESCQVVLLTSKLVREDEFEYFVTRRRKAREIPKNLIWFAEKVENEQRMYLLEEVVSSPGIQGKEL